MTTSSLFRCTLYKQALFGVLIRICSATRKTCYLLECLAPSAQNPNDRSKNASAIIGVYGRYFSFFLPSRVSCVGLQTPNSACYPGDVRSLLCLFFFSFSCSGRRGRETLRTRVVITTSRQTRTQTASREVEVKCSAFLSNSH